ncbi:MAG TPA: hypothetical protein PK597_04770 [Oscillospiraceae bacterium]|nr:hypothetical protein [Oscillospiraceae bacterium]
MEKTTLWRPPAGAALSHAYLIAGPRGSGKRALAETLAAAYVCTGPGEAPCGRCENCRKARAGIHPDVVVAGENAALSVDEVRALRRDAYIRPNEASRKVYLIPRAGEIDPRWQSALLKLLEDGPPYAAFLLLAEDPGTILPTVRSRCTLLRTQDEAAPAPDRENARRLAEAFLAALGEDGELRRMEFFLRLEKEPGELDAFLEEAAALLSARLVRFRRAGAEPEDGPDGAGTMRIVAALSAAAAARTFHVSPAHTVGYLTVVCGEILNQ